MPSSIPYEAKPRIAGALARLNESKYITRAALAESAGLSVDTISHMLSSVPQTYSRASLKRVLTALEIPDPDKWIEEIITTPRKLSLPDTNPNRPSRGWAI